MIHCLMEFMAGKRQMPSIRKGLRETAINCMASSIQFISRFESGMAFDRSVQRVFEIIEHIFCILTLYLNQISYISQSESGVATSAALDPLDLF